MKSLKKMINLKFPIPQKISGNSIYAGMHWSKRKKLADLYHTYMMPYRKNIVKDYPVDISYIFTFKSKPLDTSNCFLMLKFLEDGMVKNGIITNDSPEYVQSTTVYSQKGERDEVEITIT
jgi:hypothetical protein